MHPANGARLIFLSDAPIVLFGREENAVREGKSSVGLRNRNEQSVQLFDAKRAEQAAAIPAGISTAGPGLGIRKSLRSAVRFRNVAAEYAGRLVRRDRKHEFQLAEYQPTHAGVPRIALTDRVTMRGLGLEEEQRPGSLGMTPSVYYFDVNQSVSVAGRDEHARVLINSAIGLARTRKKTAKRGQRHSPFFRCRVAYLLRGITACSQSCPLSLTPTTLGCSVKLVVLAAENPHRQRCLCSSASQQQCTG